MRKEDRIRQQQGQNPSEKEGEKPHARPDEQAKGGASGEQSTKPQRQGGRLPLPD